ncbi:MAG: hypothetical protein Q4C34_03980 [Bacteroidales bacterium]|nr:hypothetical protein [Bacteroidales bacterium]
MKKLIIWIVCVVATVVCIDIAAGIVFDSYTARHPLKGDYVMADHLINDADEQLIVLGSSVGLNSIDTRRVQDSLGITAYNGASNGQAFPFYMTMLKCMLDRGHRPETVLLGVLDYNFGDEGVGNRYGFLAPYYGRGLGDIDRNMDGDRPFKKALLKSTFYRLNGSWFRILLYNVVSPGVSGLNGFVAKGIPAAFPARTAINGIVDITDERAAQLREFARLCTDNGIRLIIFFPPRCITTSESARFADNIRSIIDDGRVTVWDDTHMSPFDVDSTLFYDSNHININGSAIYTDTVINRLISLK